MASSYPAKHPRLGSEGPWLVESSLDGGKRGLQQVVVCHAVGKDIDKGNSFGGAEVREICPLRESCAGDAVDGSASNDLRLRTECAQHHVLRDRLLCAEGISTGWTSRTD